MIDRALHAIDVMSRWAIWIGACCMALIAILMLSEIATRYLVGRSLGVTWELSTYAMAGVIFLGAADTLRSGGHVRVGVLLETVPPALTRVIDTIATLIGLLIIGFILGSVADFVLDAFMRGTRSFEPTRVFLWVPQSVVVIGMALLFLQLAARLVRLWTGRPLEIADSSIAMDADASQAGNTSQSGNRGMHI